MAGPKPVIPFGYDIYLDIFFALNSERPMGMGVIGQIPFTRTIQYLQWLGMKDIQRDADIINRVDVAYVNAINQSQQKKPNVVKGKHG